MWSIRSIHGLYMAYILCNICLAQRYSRTDREYGKVDQESWGSQSTDKGSSPEFDSRPATGHRGANEDPEKPQRASGGYLRSYSKNTNVIYKLVSKSLRRRVVDGYYMFIVFSFSASEATGLHNSTMAAIQESTDAIKNLMTRGMGAVEEKIVQYKDETKDSISQLR